MYSSILSLMAGVDALNHITGNPMDFLNGSPSTNVRHRTPDFSSQVTLTVLYR